MLDCVNPKILNATNLERRHGSDTRLAGALLRMAAQRPSVDALEMVTSASEAIVRLLLMHGQDL